MKTNNEQTYITVILSFLIFATFERIFSSAEGLFKLLNNTNIKNK